MLVLSYAGSYYLLFTGEIDKAFGDILCKYCVCIYVKMIVQAHLVITYEYDIISFFLDTYKDDLHRENKHMHDMEEAIIISIIRVTPCMGPRKGVNYRKKSTYTVRTAVAQ